MWLAELHFEPRRSLLSAPLSIASAIAARTRRVARAQELRRRTYDEALGTNLLVGAPDTVAAKLAALGSRDRFERDSRRAELQRADPARKRRKRDAPAV